MSRHTLLSVALIALMPGLAWAQFGIPAGGGGQASSGNAPPCMIVGGRALTPVAFTTHMAGLQNSPAVSLDGVAMALVGEGAKSGGGRAQIVERDGKKVLEISMAGQVHQFLVLSPGAFWLRPEVRALIPRHRRQPVPDWPHQECNLPSRPPFGVEWKRPYLDWKPDESWLAMMLAPPVVEEPEQKPQPPPRPAAAAPAASAPAPSPAAAAPPPGMMGAPAPGGPPGPPEAPPPT